MDCEELRETAGLARLSMSEAELRAALPAFEEMLSFFAAMQTAGEIPENIPLKTAGADFFRQDVPYTESLLAETGEHGRRFITVPNVLPECP